MSKLQYIGKRISMMPHDDYHTIVISSSIESWQRRLILIWVIIWTFIGLFFAYYSRQIITNSQQMIWVVLFFGFWLYFEYKMIKVLLWRYYGEEYIKINAEGITYKRAIKNYGKAYIFYHENIRSIEVSEVKERSFGSVLQSGFWDIGNEVIFINYQEQIFKLGIQIPKDEGTKLRKYIWKTIKNYQPKA